MVSDEEKEDPLRNPLPLLPEVTQPQPQPQQPFTYQLPDWIQTTLAEARALQSKVIIIIIIKLIITF